ncbi:hypothetical protein TNCV_3077541 [Trichonephila clavipes]|nr:hypothetical protein TNCV_3077541 [Trichonephila clavipes]
MISRNGLKSRLLMHQQEYSTTFSTAFKSKPYPSTVGPFSYRPARERSSGRLCESGGQRSCGYGRLCRPYVDRDLLQG